TGRIGRGDLSHLAIGMSGGPALIPDFSATLHLIRLPERRHIPRSLRRRVLTLFSLTQYSVQPYRPDHRHASIRLPGNVTSNVGGQVGYSDNVVLELAGHPPEQP